jgi:hypothetical protein
MKGAGRCFFLTKNCMKQVYEKLKSNRVFSLINIHLIYTAFVPKGYKKIKKGAPNT